MKKQPLLLTLILLSIVLTSGRMTDDDLSSLTSYTTIKEQVSKVDSVRFKNIELIDTQIKCLQDKGMIDEPSVLLNNIPYNYKEYVMKRDTIAMLGMGKVESISIYSDVCSQEVRRLLDFPGKSKVLEVKISGEEMNDILPLDTIDTNTPEIFNTLVNPFR